MVVALFMLWVVLTRVKLGVWVFVGQFWFLRFGGLCLCYHFVCRFWLWLEWYCLCWRCVMLRIIVKLVMLVFCGLNVGGNEVLVIYC